MSLINNDKSDVSVERSSIFEEPQKKDNNKSQNNIASNILYNVINEGFKFIDHYGSNIVDQYAKLFTGVVLLPPRLLYGIVTLGAAPILAVGGGLLKAAAKISAMTYRTYVGPLSEHSLESAGDKAIAQSIKFAMTGTLTTFASVGSPIYHTIGFAASLFGLSSVVKLVANEAIALTSPIFERYSDLLKTYERGNNQKPLKSYSPIRHKLSKAYEKGKLDKKWSEWKLDRSLKNPAQMTESEREARLDAIKREVDEEMQRTYELHMNRLEKLSSGDASSDQGQDSNTRKD